MRNTRVYSITMPHALARQAERLAKKEHRTMSELMREALRKYQQPAITLDIRDYIRNIAPTPPAYEATRAQAKRRGSSQLTMAQIDQEIAAVRKDAVEPKRRSARPNLPKR